MPKGKLGKDSGVTADDIVKKDDIGNTQLAPGKATGVDAVETGNDWLDHGAKCEGQGGKATGCLFPDEQRKRVIGEFREHVQSAATNFKFAVAELKLEELMKKEEDLHWVLGLALDLAGMFVVDRAIKALTTIRAGQISKIQNLWFSTGEAPPKTLSNEISRLVANVSNESLAAKVKYAGGLGVKGAKAVAKDATVDSQKSVVLSFLDQLRDGCDLGFYAFKTNASAHSNDAELLVLWEGMHPNNHTVGAYKAALGDKLDKFKASGVTKIGRKAEQANSHTGADHTIVDRRVVWMAHHDGSKTLWYQQHTSRDNPDTLRRGEPGAADMYPDHKDAFGELGHDKAKLDRQVPNEFWNEAVAISEAKWGQTLTIEDPFNKHTAVVGDYKTRMDAAKVKRPPPQLPASPVKTHVPNYTADQFAKDLGDQLDQSKGGKL